MSLSVAYAMKRKKKMAEGGEAEHEDGTEMEKVEMPRDRMDVRAMAMHKSKEAAEKRERAIGKFHSDETHSYMPPKAPGVRRDERATEESDRDLGQHGEDEVADYGEDREDTPHPMDAHAVENQSGGEDEDMIGRIMKKRQEHFAEGGMSGMSSAKSDPAMPDQKHMCSGGDCQHFSHGGKVANSDEEITDDMPAQYDDLHLDDDLSDSDTGANSGDELGDKQEDEDRSDIVSRIMASRKKKDRMPRPA
jgi:hypothetical protein